MILCCAPTSTTGTRLPHNVKALFSPCRGAPKGKSSDPRRMSAQLSKEIRNHPAVLDWQASEKGQAGASVSWASLPMDVEHLMSSESNDDGTVQTADTADTTLSSSTQGSHRCSERGQMFAPLIRPVLECRSDSSQESIFRRKGPSQEDVERREDPWARENSSQGEDYFGHEDTELSSMLTLKRANQVCDSVDDDQYDDFVDEAISKRSRSNSPRADSPLRPRWRVRSLLDADSATKTRTTIGTKEERRGGSLSPESREMLSNYKALRNAKNYFGGKAPLRPIHTQPRAAALNDLQLN